VWLASFIVCGIIATVAVGALADARHRDHRQRREQRDLDLRRGRDG
jgi:hypothetical protein